MAFSKFATAVVQSVNTKRSDWQGVLKKAGKSFKDRTSAVAIENYSPDQYLLTHSTIMCSVDTEEPPNVKTGKVVNAHGEDINVEYPDYWITPDTQKGINCNGDAWSREVLLKTYHTFIGAENYCEHIQIPELSKGKIIDAVARDLGDHLYIDILVATDRVHKDLVARIESGELNTMSMGCTISFSQCTKCGNVAVDEPDLCRCVKYEKGNKFVGPDGKMRVVAELCGHAEAEESVKFIEASWVANPAFKGAVTRSILSPIDIKDPTKYEKEKLQSLIQEAHRQSTIASSEDWTQYFLKTATTHMGREVESAVQNAINNTRRGEDASEPKSNKSLVDEIADELKYELKHQIEQELRQELLQELKKQEEPKAMPEAEIAPNDSIHKSYQLFASRYAKQLGASTQSTFNVLTLLSNPSLFVQHKYKFSNTSIITAMYIHDRDNTKKILSSDIYKCLSKVGSTSNYKTMRAFLLACAKELGRKITAEDAKILVERAKLLN